MKGAIAELFASTSRAPSRTSEITIGASQYFLFSLINCHSSLTTCTLDIEAPSKHLFVVTRIALTLGIRPPVGGARARAPAEGIPTKQSFQQTDWRDYEKKDNP